MASIAASVLDTPARRSAPASTVARIGRTRWLIACTSGELLGFVAAASWAWLAVATLGTDPKTGAARVGLLAMMVAGGACEGALLGTLQWVALRRALPRLRASWWIGATVTVAALGWLLAMLPSTFAGSAPATGATPFDPPTWLVATLSGTMGVALGAGFGAAQWLVLRRHVRGSWHWISGNAVGWGLGLPFSFIAGSLGDVEQHPWRALTFAAIAGVMMGGAVALATAVAMRRTVPLEAPAAYASTSRRFLLP